MNKLEQFKDTVSSTVGGESDILKDITAATSDFISSEEVNTNFKHIFE